MKNILITLFLLFGANHLKAQYAPLKIGEKVPDFEFKIQNYHTPTAKLSDFRGKLIFLDFWSTTCTSCINDFPKMEAWQKQYGDKIQVILVNIRETEEEVKAGLKSRKKDIPTLKQLPSIINNTAFAQLFPHDYAGNFVWIDPEGIFRLSSGYDYNIYKAKIDDVLAGKTITFLKDGRWYNKNEPSLLEMIKDSSSKGPEIGSGFTDVNYDYLPAGGQALAQIDSNSRTIRNTYINRAVLTLYYFALKETIDKEWESKIYGPHLGLSRYLDLFHIIVKDSSIYDDRLLQRSDKTDVNIIKSYHCYEQILPQHTSTQKAHQFMREDLDRYFGLKYGTTVNIESVMISCYELKRASTKSFPEKEIKRQLKDLGKRRFTIFRSFEGIMSDYFRNLELDLPYVFNVDGLYKYMPVLLPNWKKGDTLEDFQKALKLNGLEFTKVERKMKMFVVRDRQ